MICTTIRPGKDCNFMKSSGCSYNGGLCFEVVDNCQELPASQKDLMEVWGHMRQTRTFCIFQEHFAIADDGVQGGTQFMAQM